ncbi:MAG TPA: hypothetical protein VI612_03640, partial [Candidatus Nanoarchaeia archaeon]|nr:hypothetical protein [Candidatus Nanoarchaeia archaeon]
IKLDCLEQTFVADKFGTFSIKDIPPGPCRVHAAFRDGTGFQLITVEPNQTMYIELKLDKTIVNIPEEGNYLLPVILAIAVLLLVLYFVLRKKKVVEEKKVEAGARVKDILPTLNPKERDVVNFLLANRYKATQAEIRHNTGIPRTSLARTLQSLETKNIIKIVKVGKAVKVHLTDWFLEK